MIQQISHPQTGAPWSLVLLCSLKTWEEESLWCHSQLEAEGLGTGRVLSEGQDPGTWAWEAGKVGCFSSKREKSCCSSSYTLHLDPQIGWHAPVWVMSSVSLMIQLLRSSRHTGKLCFANCQGFLAQSMCLTKLTIPAGKFCLAFLE